MKFERDSFNPRFLIFSNVLFLSVLLSQEGIIKFFNPSVHEGLLLLKNEGSHILMTLLRFTYAIFFSTVITAWLSAVIYYSIWRVNYLAENEEKGK